jgi:hypothetical protein
MNLQCPNCQKMLNIEDKFAGQMMQCPLCGGTFTAPVLPSGPGSGPPPAVPLAGPAHQSSSAEDVFSLAPSSESSAPPPRREAKTDGQAGAAPAFESSADSPLIAETSSSDYPHRYIIWISPRCVPWVAPVALALVFFLLFFYWRSVPTGVTVETGQPGSLIGWAKLFSNGLLILYFFIYLLLALPLSIGSLLLTLHVVPVPPQINHLLPWRSAIVAAVLAFAFLLILIGCISEDFATAWLGGAVWLHLIALIGLALEFWLQRRGPNRPMPRIDVLW